MSDFARTWAWNQKNLTMTQKMVLMGLADFHTEKLGCFPSYQRIATLIGTSRRTVIRTIDELVGLKLISKETRTAEGGRSTSCCYVFHFTAIQPPVGCQIVTPDGDKMSPLEQEYKDKNKITTLSWDKLTDPEEISKKDESKAFWDQAVSILISLGVAKPTAQSFTGRCLKMAEKDFQKVLDAMQLAVDNQISDPIPYIITILGGRKKKPKKQQEMENVLEFLRKSREERLRQEDDAGGFDGDGDPMLPVPPDDELGSLHEGGDQSFGGSVTRRSAKTSRPKGGHLGKVQVPSIDSGVVGYGEAAQPDDF